MPQGRADQTAATMLRVSQLLREHYPAALGLVATGSAARGEATVLASVGGDNWLSDIEMLVVVADACKLPAERLALDAVAWSIHDALREEGVTVEVELTPVHASYFSRMRPHIFAHELRAHGLQLFGETDYLGLLPKSLPWDIPDEDAWRLLSNRMVEWLALQLAGPEEPLETQFYSLTKQYLDLVTALSLFSGDYAASYEARRKAVGPVCEWFDRRIAGFPKQQFIHGVETALEFKLHPAHPKFRWLFRGDTNDLRAAATAAGFGAFHDNLPTLLCTAWWETLSELSKADVENREDALAALEQLYGWKGAVRGWGKLVLRPETRSGGSIFARIPLLAWRGSPRSLVYVCAEQLLETYGAEDAPTLRWVRSRLPVIYGRGSRDWRNLAQQCVWNWQRCLRRSYV
jgi:hypothetical protein